MKKFIVILLALLVVTFFAYKSFEYPKTKVIGQYNCGESTITSVFEIQRSDFVATIMDYKLMYNSPERTNASIFVSSIPPITNHNEDISLLPLNTDIPVTTFGDSDSYGLEIYLSTREVAGYDAFSLDEYNDIAECLQNNIGIINTELVALPNLFPEKVKDSVYSINVPPLVGIAYIDSILLYNSIKQALGPESTREFIIGDNKIVFDFNGGLSTYDYNLTTVASIFTLNPNQPELIAESGVNYFDAKNSSGITLREYLSVVQEKLNINLSN